MNKASVLHAGISAHNPHSIEIDWEVHQLIELERRGFDEPPVAALRRLLGIDKEGARVSVRVPATSEKVEASAVPPVPANDPAAPWQAEGVSIPSGTPARMLYRKGSAPIHGEFRGGKLVAAGREYDTLSEAANDLASTRDGRRTRLNGWLYWAVKMPGSDVWVTLDSMRKRGRNKPASAKGGKRK